MNPQGTPNHPQRRRPNLAPLVLIGLFLAVCVTGFIFTARSMAQEREFKNKAPDLLPIKVTLKNEQAFKKMDNKRWARDLEIEIKNTSSKPIYYLYVTVNMPELTPRGYPLAFRMKYGRKELGLLETPLQPDDVPILPGESVTLKIPEGIVKTYENYRDEEGRPDPKKIEFEVNIINFGDGTGFRGTQGTFESVRQRAQRASPPNGKARACSPAPPVRSRASYTPCRRSMSSDCVSTTKSRNG